MSRQRLHLLVDSLMFVAGLGLVQTGLLLYFVLPGHSRSNAVLGWTRHDWGEAHFYCAMTLLALLLVHFVLNWNWVCQAVYRLFHTQSARLGRGRVIAGAVTLAAVATLMVGSLVAANAIKQTDRRHDTPERNNRGRSGQQSQQLERGLNRSPAGGAASKRSEEAWGFCDDKNREAARDIRISGVPATPTLRRCASNLLPRRGSG